MNDYFDLFGITEEMVQKIISVALSTGGDYCDLFFQYRCSRNLHLEDNTVNQSFSSTDFGVGIRVVNQEQTGFSFTEELTLHAMEEAARTASAIASSKNSYKKFNFRIENLPNYYPIEKPWDSVDIKEKMPIVSNINHTVFSLDPRIIKCNISLTDTESKVLIINSEGRVTFDYRPLFGLKIMVTAEEQKRRETNISALSGRLGFEYLQDDVIKDLSQEAVRRTVDLFDAVKPEGGEMEIVLAPGSSGILLHEAIGHGLEADFNRKETSLFYNKLGKKVAAPFVSIVDDGTWRNARGSLNVDDEGNKTEKTFLVKKGILINYLHDRISSQYYGVRPTGNGRRQSFRYPPTPRMRNTYMLSGPFTSDEIIKSVKKGIYAETFSNGQVLIGAGDFTFYVKTGYLIENGKITKPVKDINIIGNGPEVLQNMVMVGDDLKIDSGTWTCGKESQEVPVSHGLPTVKVSKITVGGI
ncbi:MAG: TldD/PmbA family protein [bacterium]